jgi:hypothetical protein
MGWVENSDFEQAVPDPLAEAASGILEHMNKDHATAMIDIARHEKGIAASDVKMTAVDRLGFHLRLKTPERVRSVRVGFPNEVRSSDECRQTLVAMVTTSAGCCSRGAGRLGQLAPPRRSVAGTSDGDARQDARVVGDDEANRNQGN